MKYLFLFIFLICLFGCKNINNIYSNDLGLKSYTNNNDGTVKDNITGLIWQQGYKENQTWYEANSYCKNLTLNNDKWRIPTTKELITLIDYTTNNPAIDLFYFPNTSSDWFWGSNLSASNASSWIVYFYDGEVEYTNNENKYCVRCIKKE